jgi:hypothetical protein
MATLTPTLGTGFSNGAYTVLEHQQAIANLHAPLYWAAAATWSTSTDVLTITVGPDGFNHFVDPVTGNLREIRLQELRQIPRPSGKRYMTASHNGSTEIVLTLSDTQVGSVAIRDGRDDAPDRFGILGTSF